MFRDNSLTLASRLTGAKGPRCLTQHETLVRIPAALQAAQSRGVCVSHGFTLGWVPSAFQAESEGAVRDARCTVTPGSQGFTLRR